MSRTLILALAATLAVSGCSSRLNPMNWFDRTPSAPDTLEPRGGYAAKSDARQAIPHLLAAQWQPTSDGRLLVVTGLGPTKGWWDAALIPEVPQAAGRLRPDENGVLRLRFVANPPLEGSPDARLPANPEVDSITAALALSNIRMAGINQIVITGAGNAISLRR